MAFVQVPDRRFKSECADGAYAADPEDEFLVEPHLAPADIQDIGDRPVSGGVFRDVRVEEQDGHAADLGDPHRDVEITPGEFDGDRQGQPGRVLDPSERQPTQVVVGVVVFLVAVGVDRLAKIALSVEQPDSDGRQGHVAGGLHVVAGQHAQTTRIDAQGFVEAVFGTEIGDRAFQPIGVSALEPMAGAVGHVRVECVQLIVISGQEPGVIEQVRPAGGPTEDRDGVPIP